VYREGKSSEASGVPWWQQRREFGKGLANRAGIRVRKTQSGVKVLQGVNNRYFHNAGGTGTVALLNG